MLAAPRGTEGRIELGLAAGRPQGAPRPTIVLSLDGHELGRIEPEQAWRTYSVTIPAGAAPSSGPAVLTIRSDTFRPRDFDRANPDDRQLGVMVGQVALVESPGP